MKVGPVTITRKKRNSVKKKIKMMSYWEIKTSRSFFRLMSYLEKSRSRMPEAYSLKLTVSLTVIFYLTKTKNRTKKSLTQLSQYCFKKSYYFSPKNVDFLKTNDGIRKIKKVLILNGIVSETTFLCVFS